MENQTSDPGKLIKLIQPIDPSRPTDTEDFIAANVQELFHETRKKINEIVAVTNQHSEGEKILTHDLEKRIKTIEMALMELITRVNSHTHDTLGRACVPCQQ